MQTVNMARELTSKYRVCARTAIELKKAVDMLVAKLRTELTFNGYPLGIEAVVNAAMIDFFDRPVAEQEAIIRRNVLRLEAVLASDEEVELPFPRQPEPVKESRTTEFANPPRKRKHGTS